MRRTVSAEGRSYSYTLLKTRRRSLEIRVVDPDDIRVYAPERARLQDVDRFMTGQLHWIQNTVDTLRAYRQEHARSHPVSDGSMLLYRGEPLTLHIREGARDHVEMREGEWTVYASDTGDQAIRQLLRRHLTECARREIAQKVKHYAERVGRAPGRIAVRDQRTRWGSCSSKHNLNFNYKLIMAPEEALNYVVIHELCHLYDFNHSARFWARVQSHQPDYPVWKKWLKDHGEILGV